MYDETNTWALVLAAGDGRRLQSLTTTSGGTAVPKQFCSLRDGPSLLEEALIRAGAVAPPERTCVVVAKHHQLWWQGLYRQLPAANVIVQPDNRGTANGVLLPLLHLLARDPDAQLVLLPSDHYVRHEDRLARALVQAVEQLRWRFDEVLLLGVQPEEPDPELGYVVPGPTDGRGALEVESFVEKPGPEQARRLVHAGGLWNAFIVVCTARALLSLYRRCVPELVQTMRAAVASDLAGDSAALAALYEQLPELDFSRVILQGHEAQLRVLPVPECGWSDLGTPRRVAEALRRWVPCAQLPARPVSHAVRSSERNPGGFGGLAALSLSAQHGRLGASYG